MLQSVQQFSREIKVKKKYFLQVIRLVTTKLKSNPYNTIGLSPDQMTLGQKLASKHLINEPKSRPSSTLNRQSSASEGESSDWTWETCSDSDPEGNKKY